MKRTLLALAGLSLLAGSVPSFAAPCKDKHGKFVKCPKVCRNAKGHFMKCK